MFQWNDVHTTMMSYIVLGVITFIIIIPLVCTILMRRQLRVRKEFHLIACVSLLDGFYVIVNVYNSAWRIWTPSYALMPLTAAIDRFIAITFGKWYYSPRPSRIYNSVLCGAPSLISLALGLINFFMIKLTSVGNDPVSSLCFSSGLIHPAFSTAYYLTKWIALVAAPVVFLIVLFLHKTDVRMHAATTDWKIKVRDAYMPMAVSTFLTIFLLLIPDMLLVYLPSKSLLLTTVLYAFMLIKLLAYDLCFLFMNNQLKVEVKKMWCTCFVSNQITPFIVSDSFFSKTATTTV
ncbi:hypothetical protein CAEBREN_17139 [Caenorhabditis brenneri]|uniref:G-protein coupled receptors family 1 profile domain-containing protein n=1 Tax=Caenorhabditis brenneri TaxID=135651 RepID=G0N6I0_CAEBE|nr:hypothetical protein CAEBREN_17139 [Caenorhabditis brenneri]